MGTDAAIDVAARISGATTDIATRVTGAIRDAARATGAGFEYLLNTALRESNLNPDAKAKSSSATGLFQFIDQTWLATMKQSGSAHGYSKLADAITKTDSGRFTVADPTMREKIFALRKDPVANAVMAGEFANSNAKVLNERLGRKPTDGELYMAHFLGASGAARFIRAAEANPNARAADLFPRAAGANNSIFYDKTGAARSLKQVYAGLVTRHDVVGRATQIASAKGADTVNPSIALAAMNPTSGLSPSGPSLLSIPTRVGPAVATTTVASVKPVGPTVSAPAITPASATMRVASVAPSNAAPATLPESVSAFAPPAKTDGQAAPLFVSLYQPEQRGPVAPVVRELWGPRHAASAAIEDAIAPSSEISSQRRESSGLNTPLDLGQFRRSASRRPA